MPLFNKLPFKRIPPPENIQPDQMVFYLEATNEVFLNHSDYYMRMIDLNSTAWSCAYTRKTNLTFFEAVDSEAEALNELIHFPEFLEKPILFIVKNYTNRGRFEDLVNDVYYIMKDRYFLGEEVTYTEKSRKYMAKIVGSFVLFSDEDGRTAQTLPPPTELKEPFVSPADNFRYTLQILDLLPDGDDGMREAVPADKLFRSKNIGARQKVKLFLKNSSHMPLTGDHYIVKDTFLADGIISNLRWQLIMAGIEPIFPHSPVLQRGRTPNVMKPGYIEPEPKKVKEKKIKDPDALPKPKGRPAKTAEENLTPKDSKKRKKKEEKSTDAQNGTNGESSTKKRKRVPDSEKTPTKKVKTPGGKMSEKKKKQIQEQQSELESLFVEAKKLGIDVSALEQEEKILSDNTVLDFKAVIKETKEKEKELAKEEKKRKLREKIIWNKKREDLICDDLKPMPRFPELELPPWMSPTEFGDYLFILQFFNAFKSILPLKEIRGTTDVYLSDVVIGIKCNDPQNSSFADLMKVLLTARTDIADEEDGDEAELGNRDEINLISAQNCDPANPIHGDSIRESCEIHYKVRKIHGKSVRHLPVDWMTLSEILRLIFLTSGYYTGAATHRHRLYARGNFKGHEDPGFEFRHNFPDVMEKLKTQTVYDLEPLERLEITKAIILQLLTYAKFRNHIENSQNEIYELKKEGRRLKNWEQAQEQDSNTARLALEQEISIENGKVEMKPAPSALAKKLKTYLKAVNEGRRFDKNDLDTILLESVPYSELDLDEIVTSRGLQKQEYVNIMNEFVSKIFDIHSAIGNIYLGMDRAFRKFFVVDSLAAILIENPIEGEQLGECEEASNVTNDEFLKDDEHSHVLICSGDMETCKVHGGRRLERPRWCYINGVEQFNMLLQSLNQRGHRENELLEELNQFKPSIIDVLQERETSVENGEWIETLMSKTNDPGDTYNIDWDAELKDLLLDFEEKIEQGQMGSIVKTFSVDRNQWRENLQNLGDTVMLMKDDMTIGNEFVVKIDDAVEYSEVKKLALAFVQIVRSIGLKFIRAPFTTPTRDENGFSVQKTSELFIRWQISLLQCESLSALCLYLSTLEGCIQWDKSRLQGKCRTCRRKGAAKNLILCAECDHCFHLLCVNLPDDKPSPSDWLCTSCKAQRRKLENEEKRKSRLNQQAIQSEMEEDEELKIGALSFEDKSETSLVKTDVENAELMTRTLSGRPVKRVQYNYLDEGKHPPLKQAKHRKSNGGITRDASTSRRSNKIYESYDENASIDEDDNSMYTEDDSDRRRRNRKKASKSKSSSSHETFRSITQNDREKMAALESLLKESMRQECSWPFLDPVDIKEVPDYYDVIKRPMDLKTMMNKLKQRIYNDPREVKNDFELIVSNCEMYNEDGSEIYDLSQQLYNFVHQRMEEIIND